MREFLLRATETSEGENGKRAVYETSLRSQRVRPRAGNRRASHQKETAMSMKPMYVAIASHCVQVGPDTWEQRQEALPLHGQETLDEVMDWASRNAGKAEQVTITTVKP